MQHGTNLCTEREVKKASRELTNTISNLDPIAKVNRLQKECSELLAKLKRLEKEQIKTKRRADLMSKERDATKSELNTTKGLKAKLESLSRDTTNDNRKLRVWLCFPFKKTGLIMLRPRLIASKKKATNLKNRFVIA